MSARERFAEWLAAAGTPVGGDNLIQIEGVLYAFDRHPREQANGALVGRFYRHGPKGFVDAGGFKIQPDGYVHAPAAIAGRLPGCCLPESQGYVCSDASSEVPI